MVDYDPVIYSRLLTSFTLGFHIIFATIGVGVPVMIALAEWTGIKQKDPHYLLLARRWARGFVITVAVGVVTGTAIGLQLSLLWPNFMRIAGHTIGLPLFMETFAFFLEAIFLGIYLYTWDRVKRKIRHLLLVIPIVIGSTASAFFITTVNAFMNTPQGFSLEGGVITNIDPILAMFTPAMPTKVAHVLITCYLTGAFLLAMISAFQILKGKHHIYHKKALHLSMVSAFIFSIATVIIGDLSGKFLAEYQPQKLAAAEWHFETTNEAPLIFGGVLTEDNDAAYGLEIPYALSILAHGYPGGEVVGLEEFPIDERPPLWIHYLFDLMVLIGIYLLLVSFIYIVSSKMAPALVYSQLLLRAIVIGGPLSLLAIEFGWIFSEVGRQPWILVGVMKTSAGATTAAHVDLLLVVFATVYIILAVSCIAVLRKLFKEYPVEKELQDRGIK
ncbi:cytochrome ubiquinol oxidase subunit I [Desertibacillus haloalkaliphilus]|uniref:cytochrome ubiquinol oxidase subunit I n=1 Tax=Desertibacillus haloalkaliphilus TaxID=1328930 RepID=UPI001C252603|nr:cytochrome ubiquinol oxidase subunit I [Desertibacillus haloalkaliphilus]MBU8907899.1 cytochrome ubiquinol oxidase subunit I [Desertibacillus haloalkaliphilus]